MFEHRGCSRRRVAAGKHRARLRFLIANLLVVACLLIGTAAAQRHCGGASSIDWVPFFIGQSYFDILKRAPDAAGQISNIAALEGLNTANCKSPNPALSVGNCEWNNNAQTILDFLALPESASKNGSLSSNLSFVTAVYELLLGGGPESAGFNYYVSLLDSGASRLSVLSSLLASIQYRGRFACTSNGTANPTCNGAESIDSVPSFISQAYLDILNRPANSAGQAWWTGYTTENQVAMCRNTSASAFSVCDRVLEAQTALNLFDSSEYAQSNPPITVPVAFPPAPAEYFRRTPLDYLYSLAHYVVALNQANRNFVTALYQHLLRRTPDQTGLEIYTSYLNQTNDRVGTIYAFLTNNAYRNRFACYAGASDQLNFGINGHPFTGPAYSNTNGVDFATQVKLVQDAGLTWYRVDVSVPSSGADFSDMDLLLSAAQAHGVQLLPTISPAVDPNAKLSPAQVYSAAYSAAFSIVSRYKSSIHVWELSNEQDVYSIYSLGDPWKGKTFPWTFAVGDNPADYYPPRLANAEAAIHGMADGARAADPGCLRVVDFGWVHTGFIENLENDGIPYDIVGIHWYSNVDVQQDTGMGDMTCPGQNLPCTQPLLHVNLIQRLGLLTNGKPLWITEANYWPVIGNSVAKDLALEEAYLPPALQLYRDSPSTYPLQVVMIYELLDESTEEARGPNFGEMGLYEDTASSSGSTTLGPAKPVYPLVEQVILPK